MRDCKFVAQIGNFRRGINKGPLKDAEQEFSVDNSKLFKDAVYQAYLDAARTFTGISLDKDKCPAFVCLAESLKTYFQGEVPLCEAVFDFKHNVWCNKLICDFKRCNGYAATYGQAQKIVNMTFKYLYCCKGSVKYENHFRFCHMALDSYTQEWFLRKVLRKKHGEKGKIIAWSKLEQNGTCIFEDDKGKQRYTYGYYVRRIRCYLKGSCYTPFQMEFFIWPRIQLHLASEAFFSQLQEDLTNKEKADFESLELEEKLKRIQEQIGKVKL